VRGTACEMQRRGVEVGTQKTPQHLINKIIRASSVTGGTVTRTVYLQKEKDGWKKSPGRLQGSFSRGNLAKRQRGSNQRDDRD